MILPRVQIHFNLSSQIVGLLSASTMAGVCAILLCQASRHLSHLYSADGS